MSAIIRELKTAEEVAALEPMVQEYFRIVCGFLKSDFDVQMSPDALTANMMDSLENFIPPKGRGYVAEQDGALIGMIFLKPIRESEIEIKRLYLRSQARGQGLGKRLVRHAIDAARALGTTDLYLDSIPSLRAAISLYEAEGFERREPYSGSEIASFDILREHGVYMHLSLSSAGADTIS